MLGGMICFFQSQEICYKVTFIYKPDSITKYNPAMREQRPNKSEIIFLNITYNRFLDLYQEIISNDFWIIPDNYRFFNYKEIFFVYGEITNY